MEVESQPQICLPDATCFSSWTRLIRTTVRVIAFVKKLRLRVQQRGGRSGNGERGFSANGMIKAETFAHAEYLWCMQDVFLPELTALNHGKGVLRTISLLQLSPCLADDCLLRMKAEPEEIQSVCPEITSTQSPLSTSAMCGLHTMVSREPSATFGRSFGSRSCVRRSKKQQVPAKPARFERQSYMQQRRLRSLKVVWKHSPGPSQIVVWITLGRWK